MALKSSEVLKGNFPRTGSFGDKRGSYTHYGVDFASPNWTPTKARYTGEITILGTNPPKEDFGNYIRMLYDNSNVEGWYAHLMKFSVKEGQHVEKGQIIGYSDNTGFSFGSHLHYSESTGNLKWLDPDKTNVIQLPKEDEVTEIESKVKSFIYLYRAILNRHPNATMKKYFLYLAKKGIDPAAWSRTKYLLPQVTKTQDKYEKIFNKQEKAIEQLQIEYTKCRDRGVVLTTEIEGLKEEIKSSKEPSGVNIPRVTKFDNLWSRIWKRLLQIIAR